MAASIKFFDTDELELAYTALVSQLDLRVDLPIGEMSIYLSISDYFDHESEIDELLENTGAYVDFSEEDGLGE